MNKLIRYATIFAIVIAIIAGCYYMFCTVRTPEIDGVVIDKETKMPVQNAWIMAVVETDIRTFGGDVSIHRLITSPHTQTDGEGKFTIPSHFYYSAPPPLGWGMRKTRLRIDVFAPRAKRGAIDIYTYKQVGQPVPQDKEATVNPEPSLNKRSLLVTIPVSNLAMSFEDTKEELGWLAGYCSDGRYRFAWPIMQGGCSSLELDYLIQAYRKFISELVKMKSTNSDVMVMLWGGQTRLAYLYKIKGDYKSALEIFIELHNSFKKRGLTMGLHEQETEIKELQKKLQGN